MEKYYNKVKVTVKEGLSNEQHFWSLKCTDVDAQNGISVNIALLNYLHDL